ncbi:hypothetical protein Pmani_033613 [Petrolisthes manimaculis]|uniref:Reelin domain-containing protein n=1 Tax=Petrolisthes manimaculis TaxID=1843537 RepID=A0AAE1NP59_9EUCA|nr:hypothetical protein Pmani_033613 [Petrolisthes manimaculis]
MFGKVTTSVVLVLVLVGLVGASPTGAPITACEDLLPRHGSNASAVNEPFNLFVQSAGDNMLNVTIAPQDPAVLFKGFLVRATVDNLDQGYFDLSLTPQYKGYNCDSTHTASTHTENGLKSSVTVFWAVSQPGEITFEATVVIEKVRYVVDLINVYTA